MRKQFYNSKINDDYYFKLSILKDINKMVRFSEVTNTFMIVWILQVEMI